MYPLCCAAVLKCLYLNTLILQRFYMVFLLATLISPMGMIACITSAEDDTVCELIEDLSEEEGDDSEEESNVEESQILRHDLLQIELNYTALKNVQACFKEGSLLPASILKDTSTPPPELT